MKRVLAFYLIVCLTVVGAAWVYERTRPAQEAAAIGSSLPVVVLDAGHGGEDGGAVTATGVYESRLNLEITLRLNDFLQLLGVPTRMVRTGDVSVSTEGETVAQRKSSDIRNRVALVESIPGCWLVSVHQNRFEQEQYRGAQVFYRSSEESKRLPAGAALRAARPEKQPTDQAGERHLSFGACDMPGCSDRMRVSVEPGRGAAFAAGDLSAQAGRRDRLHDLSDNRSTI